MRFLCLWSIHTAFLFCSPPLNCPALMRSLCLQSIHMTYLPPSRSSPSMESSNSSSRKYSAITASTLLLLQEKVREGLFKSEQQLHARVGTGIQMSLFLSPCPPSSLNHSNLISPGSRGRGHCHEEWHHSSFSPSLFLS